MKVPRANLHAEIAGGLEEVVHQSLCRSQDRSLRRADDNAQMGYVFEELIRIGTEQPNEEPGNIAPRVRSSASK